LSHERFQGIKQLRCHELGINTSDQVAKTGFEAASFCRFSARVNRVAARRTKLAGRGKGWIKF
jgi:hypothetical protein